MQVCEVCEMWEVEPRSTRDMVPGLLGVRAVSQPDNVSGLQSGLRRRGVPRQVLLLRTSHSRKVSSKMLFCSQSSL